MEDIATAITVFICLIAVIVAILFSDTKVTYENGATENMLFVEAIELIIKGSE